MSQLPLPAQTLQGKVAIVTGSSRGLGAEMAMDLARRGAKVVVTYTSASSAAKAAQIVSEIQALPNANSNSNASSASSAAISVRADLGSESGPREIVASTLAAFGPHIDILVNNAAVQITRRLADLSTQDYEAVYNVNVRGVILMTQAVLPHLRAPARIINISSVGARAGFANYSLYVSSKVALEGLTRAWAGELGSDGTTVNAVAPGPVQSAMLDTISPDLVEMQRLNTPVENRLGTAPEIAAIVSWLASSDASWVSGQVVNASGGFSMY
ncbi:hypothetical protein A1O3_07278 [Capronia epimyces CBS 606.96]|uniref:3-oxoacyl-[acyl-carrier protein] reductase n=1 Tax=Capronia epimyces CBS 606.96 TaxID=1182542 RepID=W9XUH2_9EURO|nr:uncharacterized protein A1O3_07278 [Capronia epimyces CBS 606.96]EXJ80990.1 hypothetical protein A1O3_07278 [Capronia epimyces CBS 606.96]